MHAEGLNPNYFYRVIPFYKPAEQYAGSPLTGFGCWLMLGESSVRGSWRRNGSQLPSLPTLCLAMGWWDVMCACTLARELRACCPVLLWAPADFRLCSADSSGDTCCAKASLGWWLPKEGRRQQLLNASSIPVKSACECAPTLLGFVLLGTTFLPLSIMLCWSQRVKYKSIEHLETLNALTGWINGPWEYLAMGLLKKKLPLNSCLTEEQFFH